MAVPILKFSKPDNSREIEIHSNKALSRIDLALNNNIELTEAKYTFQEPVRVDKTSKALSIKPDLNKNTGRLTDTHHTCPVFFDQTDYVIKIKTKQARNAWVFSPVASLCDSAAWIQEAHMLIVPVNFGNDLGGFELCWEWEDADNMRHSSYFRGTVYSTKLDVFTHIKWMEEEVQKKFDWINLDFLKLTSKGWDTEDVKDSDHQSWLIIFQQVHTSLEFYFNRLVSNHRKRLKTYNVVTRAERIRKTNPKLEEKIANNYKYFPDKKYSVTKKTLSSDTPENRLMKHILLIVLTQINEVIDLLKSKKNISEVFIDRLTEWSESLSIISHHRFWKTIGKFQGIKKESLILSQDPTYSAIRRYWHLLRKGLVYLEDEYRGGVQNAAQLYEIWCLVKIQQIISKLGWENTDPLDRESVIENTDYTSTDEQIKSGAVKFSYIKKDSNDNILLDLLFQPTAGSKRHNNVWEGVLSYPVIQTPDMVLRLHRNDLPNKPVYTWIFDAKYRKDEQGKGAPEDAINQMHRYRDAIVWSKEADNNYHSFLSRESIGAFVLYPGEENNSVHYKDYKEAIEKVNIGAYSLKPGKLNEKKESSLPKELTDKLSLFLNIKSDFYGVKEKSENYYAGNKCNDAVATVFLCPVRKEMGKNYWHKNRLYRLPEDRIIRKSKIIPEPGQYIAPKYRHTDVFDIFQIKSISEFLNREEVEKRYKQKNYDIKHKKTSERYIILTLSEPLDRKSRVWTDLLSNRAKIINYYDFIDKIENSNRFGTGF